jgi:replicative superfamily II helicase
MQHGVPAKLVDLIEVKGIGKIKAEKLYEKGFKNKKDVLQKLEEASKVCGLKPDTLKKYCEGSI